ncbi:MAG: helix-turn-helix domain-containing protein [Clostridia bacterium]|nr:helix-turn-helix domain-containing protein [Clostridia bacterium]
MRTLLIVDDEMLIADGLRDMLAKAFEGRLNVLCRYSAAGALQAAEEVPVDVLLTDINMPNMSGLELQRAVQEKYPACLAVYLTGYSDFEYARTALEQHAYAYILKGEGDDVVISTVERALAQAEAAGRSAAGAAEEKGGSGEEDPAGKKTGEENTGAGGEESRGLIRSLQEYIRTHLNENLSLDRLAELSHFHPAYLSRMFKETTGMTVGDFINRTRQEKAESLLTGSRLTVLEISREMGFATDNYFCRWFRKRTGMSPHHYREKHRDRQIP